jgi:hypothetical protein
MIEIMRTRMTLTIWVLIVSGCATWSNSDGPRGRRLRQPLTPVPESRPDFRNSAPDLGTPGDLPQEGPTLGNPTSYRPSGRNATTRTSAYRPEGPGPGYVELPPPSDGR